MSSIDAAIIKALVDHIDKSSGTSSGESSGEIPNEPPYEIEAHPTNGIVSNLTVSGNDFIITDEGTKPLFAPGSTVLKLKIKDND